MTLLGRLLNNRRAGETHTAWNLPNLQGPELLTLTSRHFADGGSLPLEHCAKHIGGADRSPHLAWAPLPPGTAQLLLVVEDIDVPLAKPAVHCTALIDPAAGHLEPGALASRQPGPGVRVLRSTIGRGYHGPAPIKGHGPHRYVFELFALSAAVDGTPDTTPVDRARPRALLGAVTAPVLGRGRLTGVFER
ncbi:YbhB/YbcL family Raf kinase inhibitor-like protein [Streptomyces sp. NPDC088354]|uniref:YbhB/YbcL family Raf kinase inhibitor-like protein n=1 Tax=unclassified Streptomyces TaxID=2593676 RepID=UPI0029B8C063|nr:YbhB/YbcL family Raf kinase inhibitor-like protein [Streptomyces sp. MI02-7b]MDX3075429.1 YbhB/YbcL family Raf kinase inhibitor-like protein [Streptomyces sp. MI02-7b]